MGRMLLQLAGRSTWSAAARRGVQRTIGYRLSPHSNGSCRGSFPCAETTEATISFESGSAVPKVAARV